MPTIMSDDEEAEEALRDAQEQIARLPNSARAEVEHYAAMLRAAVAQSHGAVMLAMLLVMSEEAVGVDHSGVKQQ